MPALYKLANQCNRIPLLPIPVPAIWTSESNMIRPHDAEIEIIKSIERNKEKVVHRYSTKLMLKKHPKYIKSAGKIKKEIKTYEYKDTSTDISSCPSSRNQVQQRKPGFRKLSIATAACSLSHRSKLQYPFGVWRTNHLKHGHESQHLQIPPGLKISAIPQQAGTSRPDKP